MVAVAPTTSQKTTTKRTGGRVSNTVVSRLNVGLLRIGGVSSGEFALHVLLLELTETLYVELLAIVYLLFGVVHRFVAVVALRTHPSVFFSFTKKSIFPT
jgi:hypothetical protein